LRISAENLFLQTFATALQKPVTSRKNTANAHGPAEITRKPADVYLRTLLKCKETCHNAPHEEKYAYCNREMASQLAEFFNAVGFGIEQKVQKKSNFWSRHP
jgi:hypothetical protein